MSFFMRLFASNTVKELSSLDDHLLCDLGLSRDDLYEARHSRRSASFLHARAAERAASWMR
ncbi:MAG: DUF1127 domain-containing protein [Alphaproteobacteria bacterium]|nr:DUF1127 domain-containing protein [Alphaproteobacteria bacterium]